MTEREWLAIYRETVHPLYGYVGRRTGGHRELTEDVVQEAYLRALESWSSAGAPDSPLAWLKRVAQNILIDCLRHSRWTVGGEPDSNAAAVADASDDLLKSLEIYSAISSLGRKKARIIEAFYYDRMNVSEIAGAMAISERAVEGQLRRARLTLKSLLPDPQSNGGTK